MGGEHDDEALLEHHLVEDTAIPRHAERVVRVPPRWSVM